MRLGDVAANINEVGRAAEFVRIAKALAATGGSWLTAANADKELLLTPRCVELMRKTAVTPANTSGASPLMESGLIAAFVASLRNVGAFDSILPSMVRLPLKTRVALTTVGAAGAINSEMQARKISQLALADAMLERLRGDAIVVISEELARSPTREASDLFSIELRRAVAYVSDQKFIEIASSGIVTFSSSGPTAAGARQDLRNLLQLVSTGAGSSLFIITTSAIAKALSIIADVNGSAAFPDARYDGGSIAGIPIIVTDALGGGIMMLVDASGFAGASDDFELDEARHASLQLDDAPDSPPTASTVGTSLWQNNLVALKATRYFGIERLRSSAVAIVTNVSFSGNSPA